MRAAGLEPAGLAFFEPRQAAGPAFDGQRWRRSTILSDMQTEELTWEDLRAIASECIALSAALLLDVLDSGRLEDVLAVGSDIHSAAESMLAGHV